MSAPTPSTIAIVIGRKGSGKSTLIKNVLVDVPQWFVWDLKGEYADDQVGVDGARLWTDFATFLQHVVDGGDLEREVFACPKWQFPSFCRWASETESMLVVIEELSRYCHAGEPIAALADLFDRSRHAGIDLICASSRIARISKDVVHQADEVLVARMKLPRDLRFIEEFESKACAQRVRSLPLHHFLRIHQ